MDKFLKKISNKSALLPLCLIATIIIFFSIRLVITYDSAHYLNYVAIFEGNLPASSWDIVRGPIFPTIIFLFDTFFGKTNTGILLGTFLFYLIFATICYKICKEICQNYKHKNLIQNICLAVLILNPLIMGYFHVLLTEFIAITITILNVLIAYKWIFCNSRNKKHLFLYTTYIILSIIFCYHLKQPYIIISFIPPTISAIISIVNHHSLKNIIYRIGTLILSLIFLLISIVSWNKILEKMGADMNTGRDSSSLFSQQLLQTYKVTYDQDNDGKNDPISTIDAVGILFNDFVSDPQRIAQIYISNYCGLSSICIIDSSDGVNYEPTLTFAGTDTFENTAIGYRPYSASSNLFIMPNDLYNQAIPYGENTNRSFISIAMNIFRIPTNLLFKIAISLCLPFLIWLIIIKIKTKEKKFLPLFYLNLILLITSFLHIAISAGIGLIIDRYAIEAFIPSLLGIFGTITYTKIIFSKQPKKTTSQHEQEKIANNLKNRSAKPRGSKK